MLTVYRLTICALALVLTSLSIGCGIKAEKSPDVIIITLDTTRSDYLGCYGSTDVKTPNLDAFAAGSVLFENCYTASNVTRPSHASIFTSLYQKDHGVISNRHKLPDDLRLLPRVFKANGYRTAAFTGSGLFRAASSNFQQGFDDYSEPDKGVDERRAGDTNKLVFEWLDKNAGDSFFMWVHYYDPHSLYDPPPPYDSMYKKAGDIIDDLSERVSPSLVETHPGYFERSDDAEYYRNLYRGELSYVDSQFGELMDRLKELGVYDDAYIVVVADHGESLGEHEIYFGHAGLYEQVTKVPFIFKLKDERETGRRSQLVSTIDIYPTLLEMLGIKQPLPIRGRSLAGIIVDKSAGAVRNTVYTEHAWDYMRALRNTEHKFIWQLKESKEKYSKLFYLIEGKKELYDIVKDPGELTDLSGSMPGLVDDYTAYLTKFSADKMGLASEEAVDEDTKEKLRALGYVQ